MQGTLFDQMRKARGSLRTVLIPAGATTQLVGASSLRGSMTFFGATAEYGVLVDGEFQAALGVDRGIIVPVKSPTPVVLSMQFHGDLVQRSFYVFSASSVYISFVETIFQGE